MRPLPRLHALTDTRILAREDLGSRAAAMAAAGPAVALHARDRTRSGADLTRIAHRFLTLATPPEAAVIVNSRPDIAAAIGAQGVQLNRSDLRAADARRVLPLGWIGCSVHSLAEARDAQAEGADYLMLGNIYETDSHVGRAPLGLEVLSAVAELGLPVIAVGGITPERAGAVRAAGAYGVAAIRALWDADDSADAALALLNAIRG